MQYFEELPQIMYQGAGEHNEIELEVKGFVESVPPDRREEDIVFVGRMGSTIYLIIGRMTSYDYAKPEDTQSGHGFTRLTIKGTMITLSEAECE